MCACESTTASSELGSNPRCWLCSHASRRRPWNIPQSSRTVACLVRIRCFDPVTVCAAPTNSICMQRGYLRGGCRARADPRAAPRIERSPELHGPGARGRRRDTPMRRREARRGDRAVAGLVGRGRARSSDPSAGAGLERRRGSTRDGRGPAAPRCDSGRANRTRRGFAMGGSLTARMLELPMVAVGDADGLAAARRARQRPRAPVVDAAAGLRSRRLRDAGLVLDTDAAGSRRPRSTSAVPWGSHLRRSASARR